MFILTTTQTSEQSEKQFLNSKKTGLKQTKYMTYSEENILHSTHLLIKY